MWDTHDLCLILSFEFDDALLCRTRVILVHNTCQTFLFSQLWTSLHWWQHKAPHVRILMRFLSLSLSLSPSTHNRCVTYFSHIVTFHCFSSMLVMHDYNRNEKSEDKFNVEMPLKWHDTVHCESIRYCATCRSCYMI
jgi:hypothetical protein